MPLQTSASNVCVSFPINSVGYSLLSQTRPLQNDVAYEIAPLQDAIDLNIATDKELMLLNAWKQYRVDLNRIDTATAPDITWPEKPQ